MSPDNPSPSRACPAVVGHRRSAPPGPAIPRQVVGLPVISTREEGPSGMRTGKIERLSLEQWGHLFSIVGVLLGLVSIVSVMVQLHEHNKITRAENAQKLVELTMISNMELVKDPKLASLWTEGNENFDSLSKEDKGTFKRIWIIYLNILESAFHQ